MMAMILPYLVTFVIFAAVSTLWGLGGPESPPPIKGQVWCAGCDEIVHSDWMVFADGWRYRCDVCRGEKKPLVVRSGQVLGCEMVTIQAGSRTETMTAQQYRKIYATMPAQRLHLALGLTARLDDLRRDEDWGNW